MNYKNSQEILKLVKDSKKILLNCHRRPDPDSVSSALAMYSVLEEMGEEVDIICPDSVPENLDYMDNFEKIKKVDFMTYNFSNYDLFIVLDSGTWDVISDNIKMPPPRDIKILKIDHHDKQEKFENISIIDDHASSASEILYLMFKDWQIIVSKRTASALLSGIIADSVCFSIPLTSSTTLDAASDLIKLGAEKDLIMDKQFNSIEPNLLKFFGEVLQNLQFDNEYNFVWAAIPHSVFSKYKGLLNFKNATANMFFAKVKNSLLGVLMVEEKREYLGVSFRSARRFDTSLIASELGGGGHHDSSATKIEGFDFDQAVDLVLSTTRKILKSSK